MKSVAEKSSTNYADLFDMARNFMLYLRLKKMVKRAIISRIMMARQVLLIAPWRAIFFWVVGVALLSATMLSVSCSRTSARSGVDSGANPTDAVSTVDVEPVGIEPAVPPEPSYTENDILKEENRRLRAEIVRLNLELAAAHEAIYTLNRKLDAIFNPAVKGE